MAASSRSPVAGIVLGRDEQEEHVRQLPVNGLEGDPFAGQAEQEVRGLEPQRPAMGHGDAVADGRRPELLPLEELVEKRAVGRPDMPRGERPGHLAQDPFPVAGLEPRQDERLVEQRVELHSGSTSP